MGNIIIKGYPDFRRPPDPKDPVAGKVVPPPKYRLSLSCAAEVFAEVNDWTYLGDPGIVETVAPMVAVALDSNDVAYIAFQDLGVSSKATVAKFEGGTWSVVGTRGFTADGIAGIDILIDVNNIPYVAYRSSVSPYNIYVMKWSGASWDAVGAGAAAGPNAASPRLDFDSSANPWVGYYYTDTDTFRVSYYSGGAWAVLGGDIHPYGGTGSGFDFKLAPDGTPYGVSAYGSQSDFLFGYTWNGSDWVSVGSLYFGAGVRPSMIINDSGNPEVVAIGPSYKAVVYQFNGSSWVTLGTVDFGDGSLIDVGMARSPDGDRYVMTTAESSVGGTHYPLHVYMLDSGVWAPFGTQPVANDRLAQQINRQIKASNTRRIVGVEDWENGNYPSVRYM